MKKLFFILSLGIIALKLTSCLPAGANMQELTTPAVVSYNINEGLPSILTVYGEFVVPSWISTDLNNGDCIITRFTLDWDNQPKSDPPYQATNVVYDLVEQSPATVQNDFIEMETILPADDLLPIQELMPWNYSFRLNGKFFMDFEHSAPQKQDIKYIAIVKPNIEPLEDVLVDVYLFAQKLNKPDASNVTITNIYAIDMYGAIMELGQDTTITDSMVEYRIKELKMRIKYYSGLDEKGFPVYKTYKYDGNSTISLSILLL